MLKPWHISNTDKPVRKEPLVLDDQRDLLADSYVEDLLKDAYSMLVPPAKEAVPEYSKQALYDHEMMRRQAYLAGLTGQLMKPGSNAIMNAFSTLEAFDKKFPTPISV